MSVTRIFDLLDQNPEKYPGGNEILAGKVGNKWISYNASEYRDICDKLSLGLLTLGLKKDDKVATIVNNCPEWNFFDMALMQIGAVQIPIYPTISQANYEYILKETEVKYIVVSNLEIYERIKHILPEIQSLQGVYSIEKCDELNHWKEILDIKMTLTRKDLDTIKTSIHIDDPATIIYTSGTTGNPKGVILSHSNFIHNFQGASNILSLNPVKKALSFLPLCHVFERMVNYMYQNMGISIYYCDSIEHVGDFMREVHPEIFGAVPRVIEKTYDKLVKAGRGLKGVKKQLFFWALNLAHHYEFEGKGWLYNTQLKIADKLIFTKWREAFGGNLNTIISGGASLNPRLARTFWAAGIKIMEGYGLTETSPVIAVGIFEPKGVKFGTVGPIMENVEVKFAGDGEILTKGPCLMQGYYKQTAYTKEVIDNEGWFHTGDIGEMVEGKYLKITDRKKEIFKTSGGKYVAPQVVENKFKESSFIENIIVVGENRKFTTAIVLANFEHIESWCKVKSHPWESHEKAMTDPRIVNRIQREIEEANQSLDKVEQVRKFELISEPWTIENGELSPTLKLRRKIILNKHQDLIEKMYTE
jgi:long-chain acyl-CoA synthetase